MLRAVLLVPAAQNWPGGWDTVWRLCGCQGENHGDDNLIKQGFSTQREERLFSPGLPLTPCRCSWDCDIIWFRVYSCFTSPIGFLFVVAAEIIIFRRTFFTAGGSSSLLAFIWWRLSKCLPARPCWPPQGCWVEAAGGPAPHPIDGGPGLAQPGGAGHRCSGLCIPPGPCHILSGVGSGLGAVRPLGMSEPSVGMFSKLF